MDAFIKYWVVGPRSDLHILSAENAGYADIRRKYLAWDHIVKLDWRGLHPTDFHKVLGPLFDVICLRGYFDFVTHCAKLGFVQPSKQWYLRRFASLFLDNLVWLGVKTDCNLCLLLIDIANGNVPEDMLTLLREQILGGHSAKSFRKKVMHALRNVLNDDRLEHNCRLELFTQLCIVEQNGTASNITALDSNKFWKSRIGSFLCLLIYAAICVIAVLTKFRFQQGSILTDCSPHSPNLLNFVDHFDIMRFFLT
jgi:hypothetical protein